MSLQGTIWSGIYLRATARFGWTKAVLQHQLDNKSYQEICSTRPTRSNPAGPDLVLAALAVKDHYILDFLILPKTFRARAGTGPGAKVAPFFTEMGGMFTLSAVGYRLRWREEYSSTSTAKSRTAYTVVVIELKIEIRRPEHKGKMESISKPLTSRNASKGETPHRHHHLPL